MTTFILTEVKCQTTGDVFFDEGMLIPGKSQHLVLQRIDNRIRLEIDGVDIFHHADTEAFPPGQPGRYGFIQNYGGKVIIEEITFSKPKGE